MGFPQSEPVIKANKVKEAPSGALALPMISAILTLQIKAIAPAEAMTI
jgi:hypothetical protein